MGEFDDIKRKLNLDELDKEYRNKMYNKFVEKGGEVVDNKKRHSMDFNREKQILFKEVEQKKREQLKNQYSNKQKINDQEQPKKKKKTKRYFWVFLTGFFQKIFTFSGNLNSKFSLEMHQTLPDIISDLHSAIKNFLDSNTDRKWKNVEIINNLDPNGYEILIRLNELYKENRNERISKFFNFTNNIICPQIIDDLKTLFRELFILYPCWETTKEIIWKSEQLYNTYTSKEPFLPKNKINKYIDKIYSYFFPRILTILNYNLGKKISYNYQQLKNFLNLKPEEEISFITKNLIAEKKQYIIKLQKAKEETLKKLHDDIDKKDMDKIPKYILKGLKLIDEIIEKKSELRKNDPTLKLLNEKEKILEIYCILHYFDIEFSFIMTTSQIKFNPKIETGRRIDKKSDLESLYIRYNEINGYFKEYFDFTNQLIKFKDPGNRSKSYSSSTAENLSKKKFMAFIEIKNRASDFFKKFAIIMQTIIQDYNTEKKFLDNPDEKLHFQSQKGITPKLENMTVINAILIAFSFSSAIHYYLSTEKIMSKGLYFIEEDKNQEQKPDENITQKNDNNIDL